MKHIKNTCLGLGTFVLAATTQLANAQESSDFADALFRAAPTPQGYFQIGVSEEYFTSNFFYSEFDFDAFDGFGEDVDFVTDEFETWTTNISVALGLTESLELAIRVPLEYASWEAAPDDDLSQRRSISDFGIGDVEIGLGFGYESDDQSLYIFLSGGAGLPTSNLDEFFGGATASAFTEVEVEKYFGNLGVVLGAGAVYSDFEDFGPFNFQEDGWSWEYRVGLAYLFGENLYGQVVYVGAPEENVNRVEAFLELLISDRASIEIFGAQDVSGDEEGTLGGVGVNLFLGQ